jgi:hypothetical protein
MNMFRVAPMCLDSVCGSQSPSSGVPLTVLMSDSWIPKKGRALHKKSSWP